MTNNSSIYFWSGKYNNCLLIQDGKSGRYDWYWSGDTVCVSPPDEIQVMIDMWTETKFAGLELGEFLDQLIGEE